MTLQTTDVLHTTSPKIGPGGTGATLFGEYTRGAATQFERPGSPSSWRVFSFDSAPLTGRGG